MSKEPTQKKAPPEKSETDFSGVAAPSSVSTYSEPRLILYTPSGKPLYRKVGF